MTTEAARRPLSRAQTIGAWCAFFLLAVGLVVPFAENDAGCVDHCHDATNWYVWHPYANPGALFIAIGVASLVLALLDRPGSRPRRWLGALVGWFGVGLMVTVAPEAVDELVYGGPEIEPRAGGVAFAAGYAVLFAAAWPSLVRPGTK